MIEFKTEKGEFVVVDATTLDIVSGQALVDEYGDYIILSEATEEDAKGVVDDRLVFQSMYVKDMVNAYTDYENATQVYTKALPSLHSLLTSKGIDINNGNWCLFRKV